MGHPLCEGTTPLEFIHRSFTGHCDLKVYLKIFDTAKEWYLSITLVTLVVQILIAIVVAIEKMWYL